MMSCNTTLHTVIDFYLLHIVTLGALFKCLQTLIVLSRSVGHDVRYLGHCDVSTEGISRLLD